MPTCLHIVKSADPASTGICRIISGLARHAQPHEYRVSVLFLEDGILRQSMEEQGIPASVVPWSMRRDDLRGAWRFLKWLRRHPVDLAHVHHGGGGLRALCRAARAQAVVQHIHGQFVEIDLTPMRYRSFRGADAVIACSQAIADSITEFKAEVIYAGIETAPALPSPPAGTGPFRIGVLSRLVPLKRIEAVIEATARLTTMGFDIVLEIGGGGPSEAALRELAAQLGVCDKVHFLGWQREVGPLLASWHVLAMPSMTEGFPIAVLDAMAAGRTVVASRVGGLIEMIEDGMTGRLIPAGDTDSLTLCIAELARDRALAERMGVAAWKRAGSKYSAVLMTEKIVGLYDRLLERETRLLAAKAKD